MEEKQRSYIAIDLKSFFASVECVERGLDPLRTNLVVADITRTEKTICLAVTPSLKAYGIGGRARLFQVVQRVREVNMERLCFSPEGIFNGKSVDDVELQRDMSLELDYIVAPPRMRRYIDYSKRIYKIYLRHVAPEDIFPYSIDEVFIDVTNYLSVRKITPRDMATRMISDVFRETGITATAGIGTNLYLCKVAMDIEAKHANPDANGARIAELDEMSYRRRLWTHTPLNDFWQIGRATRRKLEAHGMKTMGDIARRSLTDEDLLFRLFGTRAELIIDHAWGWEPSRLEHRSLYKPKNRSLSSGQVLKEAYPAERARVVVREIAVNLAARLMRHDLVSGMLVINVAYDVSNITESYTGELAMDYYGRVAPPPTHGSVCLPYPTNLASIIAAAAVKLYDNIVDSTLLVRRINIATCNVEQKKKDSAEPVQLGIFDNPEDVSRQVAKRKKSEERESRLQKVELDIKERFGNNAILLGSDFDDGATTRERNAQIGGHKA